MSFKYKEITQEKFSELWAKKDQDPAARAELKYIARNKVEIIKKAARKTAKK